MVPAQSTIETQLRSNSPDELQSHGMEYFADLNYRVEVARRMAQNSGTTHALLFDDVAFAVPEEQRPKLHALPGYERALLPALFLAPGFEDGASVLVSAPPNPIERQNVLSFHRALENRLNRSVPYQIVFESEEGIVDLSKLSGPDYYKLCYRYAQKLNEPRVLHSYEQWHHLNILNRQDNRLIGDKRTFVIPFQVTEHHQSALGSLIDRNLVVLPSQPNLDKATNNFLLRESGYTDIPVMLVVTSQGEIMTGSHQLQEYKLRQLSPVPAANENVTRFANAVLSAVDRLAQEGKKAYIKLDSNGVSGLGNLAHKVDDYAIIYDATRPRNERLKILISAISNNYHNDLPDTAVIEEFVQASMFQGVKRDTTVAGVMIGGTFLPTSNFPFAVNENDEYVAGWMAENAETVGEAKTHWQRLFHSFAQMGKVMARAGYTDGVLAGDVLTDAADNIYLHDYNFRRGGRSYLEAMISLWPGGLFEAQIEVDELLPQGLTNEQRYLLYTDVCNSLLNSGGIPIFPFSTAFGYFGADHAEGNLDFAKFKVAVPMRHPLVAGKPRDEHFTAVKEYVESLMHEHGKSK